VDDDLEITVPDEARTHAGFRAWAKSDACPERARVTFFNGEILIDMSKEEIETHAKLKGEIATAVNNINRTFDLGECYPDGVLVSNEETGLSTNPDLTFVLWETLEAKKVILVPRQGTSTWSWSVVHTSSWKSSVGARFAKTKSSCTQRITALASRNTG
jgi:hypothetical protein